MSRTWLMASMADTAAVSTHTRILVRAHPSGFLQPDASEVGGEHSSADCRCWVR